MKKYKSRHTGVKKNYKRQKQTIANVNKY